MTHLLSKNSLKYGKRRGMTPSSCGSISCLPNVDWCMAYRGGLTDARLVCRPGALADGGGMATDPPSSGSWLRYEERERGRTRREGGLGEKRENGSFKI